MSIGNRVRMSDLYLWGTLAFLFAAAIANGYFGAKMRDECIAEAKARPHVMPPAECDIYVRTRK